MFVAAAACPDSEILIDSVTVYIFSACKFIGSVTEIPIRFKNNRRTGQLTAVFVEELQRYKTFLDSVLCVFMSHRMVGIACPAVNSETCSLNKSADSIGFAAFIAFGSFSSRVCGAESEVGYIVCSSDRIRTCYSAVVVAASEIAAFKTRVTFTVTAFIRNTADTAADAEIGCTCLSQRYRPCITVVTSAAIVFQVTVFRTC